MDTNLIRDGGAITRDASIFTVNRDGTIGCNHDFMLSRIKLPVWTDATLLEGVSTFFNVLELNLSIAVGIFGNIDWIAIFRSTAKFKFYILNLSIGIFFANFFDFKVGNHAIFNGGKVLVDEGWLRASRIIF